MAPTGNWFDLLPKRTHRTVEHGDDPDFMALVNHVDSLLRGIFEPQWEKGSNSWKVSTGHTFWKVCFYGNSMAFELRKTWVAKHPALATATAWERQFEVLPHPGIWFVGFEVSNDAASLDKIREVINAVFAAAAPRRETPPGPDAT
jgi:hypothetical protein